ncbi:hypothetical protein EV714DRAFT_240423 [Schizophyllum commune]
MLIVPRSARDDAPDGYDEGDIDADSINTELIASKDAAPFIKRTMTASTPFYATSASLSCPRHCFIALFSPSASADAMGDAWNAPSTTTSLTTTRDTSGYMVALKPSSTPRTTTTRAALIDLKSSRDV